SNRQRMSRVLQTPAWSESQYPLFIVLPVTPESSRPTAALVVNTWSTWWSNSAAVPVVRS
ncbi:MAG: hypothetical protein ACXVQ5_11455, partial [Actinomycetota bacterium]